MCLAAYWKFRFWWSYMLKSSCLNALMFPAWYMREKLDEEERKQERPELIVSLTMNYKSENDKSLWAGVRFLMTINNQSLLTSYMHALVKHISAINFLKMFISSLLRAALLLTLRGVHTLALHSTQPSAIHCRVLWESVSHVSSLTYFLFWNKSIKANRPALMDYLPSLSLNERTK